MYNIDPATADAVTKAIISVREKTQKAMYAGPGSPDVVLTAEEATIVYRLLFEGK